MANKRNSSNRADLHPDDVLVPRPRWVKYFSELGVVEAEGPNHNVQDLGPYNSDATPQPFRRVVRELYDF